MAKIKRTKDGEVIYNVDLTQDEINAISYAMDVATESDDTYDVDTHDYLQEFFAEMWAGDYLGDDEGPSEYSGFGTSIAVIEEDTQSVVLNFNELRNKDKEAHGFEDEY